MMHDPVLFIENYLREMFPSGKKLWWDLHFSTTIEYASWKAK